MSRGLGGRQRLLLAAAAQVERRYRQGAWLPLGMVLCAAWTPEVASEAEAAATARARLEAAEVEAWKRAVAELGAATGDPVAIADLHVSRRSTSSAARSGAGGRDTAAHRCSGIPGPNGC